MRKATLIYSLVLVLVLLTSCGGSSSTVGELETRVAEPKTQLAQVEAARTASPVLAETAGPPPPETPEAPPPVATAPPPPPETPEASPPPVATPTPPPPAASLPRGDLLGDMILVPAGEFIMGSSQEQIDYAFRLCEEAYGDCQRSWFYNELPQHTVYLDAFYLGRYEVTNAQYERFVEATGYEAPPMGWPGGSIPGGRENHPVVDVSWYDALAYCRWLSEETGLTVRLPTEAEWEKAARGTDGRVYPWGDEFDAGKCNSGEDDIETTPVGEYSPQGDSPYGVADMSGNVWEWTSSLYRAYPYDADDGREDLKAEGDRVLRGGSFYYDEWNVRCACPTWLRPGERDFNFGFRIAVSPGSSTSTNG